MNIMSVADKDMKELRWDTIYIEIVIVVFVIMPEGESLSGDGFSFND